MNETTNSKGKGKGHNSVGCFLFDEVFELMDFDTRGLSFSNQIVFELSGIGAIQHEGKGI